MRKVVDDAQPRPLQQAALKWGTRLLGPDNLAVLDEAIADNETSYEKTAGICKRPNFNKIFSLSTPAEQLAFFWFALKLGPDKLDELDRMIGRNELLLSEPATKTSKERQTDSPGDKITVTWIQEPGLPHQVRRH